jgi:hypothetical protein
MYEWERAGNSESELGHLMSLWLSHNDGVTSSNLGLTRPGRCRLHGVDLVEGIAPIHFGYFPAYRFPPGYVEAREAEFPLASAWVPGGCVVFRGQATAQPTLFCPSCRDAERRWIERRSNYESGQTSSETPMDRRAFEAQHLMDEYPPIPEDANKQIVFRIACPPRSKHGGRLVYTRWKAMPLPDFTEPFEAIRSSVLREGFYDYIPVLGASAAVEWHVNFADPELFVAYRSASTGSGIRSGIPSTSPAPIVSGFTSHGARR